jgi:hypothetical protein
VTNRIAQPTNHNPLRISTSWSALPSSPTGERYGVIADAIISFAKHPSIPPRIVKGITESARRLIYTRDRPIGP